MSDLNNPHDKFFKESFAQLEVARDFLRNYLPADVTPLLDLAQLELEKETFIDPDLQEHFSDLLYSAPLIDTDLTAFVYILLEHKSYPDPLTPFQLLRYMTRFWERRLRQGHTNLEPIIPIVVYHGRERWPQNSQLLDLYNGPTVLRAYLPNFAYQLCDLSLHSDADIRGEASLQIALRIMRYIFDRELAARLPEILILFRQLANQQTALQYLETVLRYLSATSDRLEPADLHVAVKGVFARQGEALMSTIAERWIEEGKAKGLQQGMQQGMEQATRQTILDLLELRLDLPPYHFRDSLEEVSDLETLRLLTRRAATVDTADEFAQALAAFKL